MRTRMAMILLLTIFETACIAGDNKKEVRDSLDSKYERFYPGPELSHAEMLKAIETKGASLVDFANKAADFVSRTGQRIQADAVLDLLFRQRGIPDISGGIAAVNHWHEEKVPYWERNGPEISMHERTVRIPEANTYFFWVGYRHKQDPPVTPAIPERFIKAKGSPHFYVYENGKRRYVPDEPTLASIVGSTKEVEPAELERIQRGPTMPSVIPNVLIRAQDKPEVYLVEKGIRRHVPDMGTFDANGYQWEKVQVLPSANVNAVTLGQPLGQRVVP